MGGGAGQAFPSKARVAPFSRPPFALPLSSRSPFSSHLHFPRHASQLRSSSPLCASPFFPASLFPRFCRFPQKNSRWRGRQRLFFLFYVLLQFKKALRLPQGPISPAPLGSGQHSGSRGQPPPAAPIPPGPYRGCACHSCGPPPGSPPPG